MNSFKDVFKKKAFIGFLTAGDPNIDATERFIYKMIEAGASLIEIGIPFSDPIAEGNTIYNADMRALKSNTTTDKVFDMVLKVRKKYPDLGSRFFIDKVEYTVTSINILSSVVKIENEDDVKFLPLDDFIKQTHFKKHREGKDEKK